MSRNLLATRCADCDKASITIQNLIGKKLEFRQYYEEVACPGVPWTCPNCHTKYFVMIERYYSEYEHIWKLRLDLSYYESYNDEHDSVLENYTCADRNKFEEFCVDKHTGVSTRPCFWYNGVGSWIDDGGYVHNSTDEIDDYGAGL